MLSTVLGFLTPVVDKFFDNKDQADKFKQELSQALIQGEGELRKAQSAIITGEASGESWLQRNWRPLTMLSFLGLLFLYWLGYAPSYVANNPQLAESLFDLLRIGIGGYIGGRSLEKVAKTAGRAVRDWRS